ncbi:XRE family transcriptional regulator [Pseudomonas sp. LTJR-52]|uniref:helix-turn-helix domain-containing protein n=1 Tax=Pseudomonas sp. LTJR-52 TaxID=2479392 RepID=UPI000EFB6F48|nr:helix-turn-helix transcriptional regulator [Pseudomonas sp. LTJR-52]AYN97419.1 XRE family transcriptional regulator [Pseudomonas sp. LTJR-52]
MMNDDDTCKVFGRRLRDIRLAAGMSQEELASRAELDRTYVSGCERGKRNPSLKTIAKLAKALKINLTELFNG